MKFSSTLINSSHFQMRTYFASLIANPPQKTHKINRQMRGFTLHFHYLVSRLKDFISLENNFKVLWLQYKFSSTLDQILLFPLKRNGKIQGLVESNSVFKLISLTMRLMFYQLMWVSNYIIPVLLIELLHHLE